MAEGSQMFKKEKIKESMLNYLGLILVLILMIVFFSLKSEYFFTTLTFNTIANQIPSLTVTAVGMTFVLMIAGIDLSVGSVMALSAMVLSMAIVDWHWSITMSCILALFTAGLAGFVNGFVTVTWRIPSFIVTLGMLEMCRGAAFLTSDSRTKYIGEAIGLFSEPWFAGMSLSFVMSIVIVCVAQVILSKTVFGRYVIGIGCNEEVMRLSGINTGRIKMAVFVFSGMSAGLAALFQTSRLEAANPDTGVGFELQAIAATVIGGTSLMGGRGSVINTFVGVLIVSVLAAGLAQIGASEPSKRFITGGVIVLAVIFDKYRSRMLGQRVEVS